MPLLSSVNWSIILKVYIIFFYILLLEDEKCYLLFRLILEVKSLN